MPSFRFVLALVAICMMAAAAHARELVPPAGWGTGEDLDQAIEYAQKKGLPIVFVHTFKETDCPKCIGATTRFTSERGFQNMVALMVYESESSPKFRQVEQQVKDHGTYLPRLYITDPELNLIAFVKYEDSARGSTAAAAMANEFMAWRSNVPKRVDRADAQAARRAAYSKSLEQIEKIAAEDRAVSAKLDQILRGVEPAKKADADAEAPAAKGRFFPNIVEEARQRYEQMAAERLAEARTAIEQEDYVAARRVLTPMVRDGADLPQIAEAANLLKQVESAQAQARAE